VLPLVHDLMVVSGGGSLDRKLFPSACVSFYRVAHKKKPSARDTKGCFFSRRARRLPRRSAAESQLVKSWVMMSPNSSHFSPLKRIICSCLIGEKWELFGDIITDDFTN